MSESLGTGAQDIWSSVEPYLPTLAVALAILVGGVLTAYVLRAVTFAALKRTQMDNRLAFKLGIGTTKEQPHRLEHSIAQAVFYLTLAFVFVAFFSQLHIDSVTSPVVGALEGVVAAVPNLVKAGVIGLVGLAVAMLARRAVVALVDRTGLSEHLASMSSDGPERRVAQQAQETTYEGVSKLASVLGDVAYWLILAVTAVPVLEALRVGALAEPLSRAFETVATYLPRAAGAALLMGLGYIAARLLGGLTSGLTARLGIDRLAARLGGARVLRERTISGILGSVVMAFVLLHFAISAVGRLGVAEISEPLGVFLDSVYAYLPRLFVGGIVMSIGALLARVTGNIASTLLASMGFNRLMGHLGFNEPSKAASEVAQAQEARAKTVIAARRGGETLTSANGEDVLLGGAGPLRDARTPADFAGIAASAVVGVMFLAQALRTMELHGLAGMLDRFIAYLPSLLAASLAVGAALWAGRWAHRRVDQLTRAATRDDPLFRSMGTATHVAIVAFGAMAALQQLGVAGSLIGTAFGLVLGALCLAAALAFGLGGRDVAADIVRREYQRHKAESIEGRRTIPEPAE